jgi:hypothetical protein
LIQQLLEEQLAVGVARIINRFSLQDLIKPRLSMASLASLLFYFGMTTVQGRNAQGKLQLRIPNQVTHGLYFEQLRELLLPLRGSSQ